MKQLLRNLKLTSVIFVLLAVSLLSGIIYHQRKSQQVLLSSVGESKSALAERFAHAGSIYTADGVRLAYSEEGARHYADDWDLQQASLHLVGDYTQNITNTIESSYQDHLTGSGRSSLYQLLFDFTGHGLESDDIYLTIDSNLTKQAYYQLADYRGAALVLNYQTGEVVCSVSSPSCPTTNVVQWEDIPETALFNRCLLAEYAPGSTFKLVTGLAWLNSPDYQSDYLVNCRGREPLLGEGSVYENRSDAGHGSIGMQDAYAYSCNHFFGEVAVKAGADLLDKAAENFLFNRQFQLDRLHVNPGQYYLPENDLYSLTWQAIGQPIGQAKLSLSPLHMAMIAGAIANEGVMMEPHIIQKMTNPLGSVYNSITPKSLTQVGDPAEMAVLKKGLEAVVDYGTGQGAYQEGLVIAGKTGTAEYQREDGELVTNNIFIGYIDSQDTPYAVAVVLENAGEGAAAVAGRLLATASTLNP